MARVQVVGGSGDRRRPATSVLGGLMYTRWPIGVSFELDMSDYVNREGHLCFRFLQSSSHWTGSQ
jgi:hypothetical protein